MSDLIVNTEKLGEIYKEWRGNESCYDNGKPIFDADELLDFAEFCLTHKTNGVSTSDEALPIARVGGNEVALKLKQFAEKQQDIPDDIHAIINDNFWDLL